MQNNKIIEFQGKILKRIFNPEQLSSKGIRFSIAYLVLEWITGPNGEYKDIIAIKTFSPKFFKDVRAGYKVNIKARYGCSKRQDEIPVHSYTKDNITFQSPSLFPDFTLINNSISIIDMSENLEEYVDVNQNFEKQILAPGTEEDDLPF